jgi:hypothetical protein
MPPKNDLSRLQRAAATPGCAVVLLERASFPTSKRLGLSIIDAERYALATVRSLTGGDFVKSVLLRQGWFDEYARYRDGVGWYIKVGEDDDGLLVISHHPPEYGPLTTVSGRVIDVTDPAAPAP